MAHNDTSKLLTTSPLPFPPQDRFGLSNVELEGGAVLPVADEWRGKCVVEIDRLSPWQPDYKPWLEAAFFHPAMSHPRQYWPLDRRLMKKQTTVSFHFPRLAPPNMPPPILGTALVYLRLVTPCNFGPIRGIQRASNVVAVPVELK